MSRLCVGWGRLMQQNVLVFRDRYRAMAPSKGVPIVRLVEATRQVLGLGLALHQDGEWGATLGLGLYYS